MRVLEVLTNFVVEGCGTKHVYDKIKDVVRSNGHEIDTIAMHEFPDAPENIVFSTPKRTYNNELIKQVAKMHFEQPYNAIHIHGGFHHFKSGITLRDTVGPEPIIVVSTHLYSDVGLSVFASLDSMVEATEKEIYLDFINEWSMENMISMLNQDQRDRLNRKYLIWTHNSVTKELPLVSETKSGICYMGRVSHGKGIGDILSYAIHGDLDLDIYGNIDDECVDWLNKITEDNPKIKYKGFLKHDKVIDMLNGYKALLLPSPTECMSLSAIEAMSVGTYVITNPVCHGSNYVNHIIGLGKESVPLMSEWYRKSAKTRGASIGKVYHSIVEKSHEDHVDLAYKTREALSYNKFADDIMKLYRGVR